MQKKLKILMAIAVCILASSLVAATAVPAIASWIDNSIVSVVTSTANSSFTTTVVGVYTNASANALTISNGGTGPYTSANIQDYNTGPMAGNPSSPSVASMVASGWVPNDMVEFQVTITNTGTTTLAFAPYTISCYFVSEPGNIPITTGPFTTSPYPAYTNHYSEPWTFLGFYGVVGGGISDALTLTSATDGPATLAGTNQQIFADNLIDANAGGNNINWEVGWGTIGASTIPATLAPSATFVYNIYMGLGTNVPYNIPNMFFSLSIPMTIAN